MNLQINEVIVVGDKLEDVREELAGVQNVQAEHYQRLQNAEDIVNLQQELQNVLVPAAAGGTGAPHRLYYYLHRPQRANSKLVGVSVFSDGTGLPLLRTARRRIQALEVNDGNAFKF